jgi:hypothetical protein
MYTEAEPPAAGTELSRSVETSIPLDDDTRRERAIARALERPLESETLDWGRRKRKRDNAAIYRWALDHVEAIAIDLLRLPGYIGGGPQGGYKTKSGKHYIAENGTRYEGLSVTLGNNLDGKGKGMFRTTLPGMDDAFLLGDLFGLVMHVKKFATRDQAASWIAEFKDRFESREYREAEEKRIKQEHLDDLDDRDLVFKAVGEKRWYGTEGELRKLLERTYVGTDGGTLDPRSLLRQLKGLGCFGEDGLAPASL